MKTYSVELNHASKSWPFLGNLLLKKMKKILLFTDFKVKVDIFPALRAGQGSPPAPPVLTKRCTFADLFLLAKILWIALIESALSDSASLEFVRLSVKFAHETVQHAHGSYHRLVTLNSFCRVLGMSTSPVACTNHDTNRRCSKNSGLKFC
jgi:hypothetical protein